MRQLIIARKDFGVGRTLICVGFIPMSDDFAHKISKKFQLYK